MSRDKESDGDRCGNATSVGFLGDAPTSSGATSDSPCCRSAGKRAFPPAVALLAAGWSRRCLPRAGARLLSRSLAVPGRV